MTTIATRNISSLLNICIPKFYPFEISHKQASSKSYNAIPKNKSLLPDSWHLVRAGGPGYLHEHCDRRHKELGPIFRERLGPNELLFIADTKMIQTVIANEGPRPHHNVPEAWLLYNEIKNIERGLFFQLGEPWHRIRRVFNKVLLADVSKITRFTSSLLEINSDLLNSWKQRKGSMTMADSKSIVIHDIKSELCKWSIEATGLMLFGNRMGCIASPSDGKSRELEERRAEQLVKYVAAMFTATSSFQILPCRLAQRFNLDSWQRFEQASDGMIKLANEYAREFMLKAKESRTNESLVRDLLDLQVLDDDEIARSLVDLIIAAADTTSNSLQWMLYSLAKYPNVQMKILTEVETIDESLQDIRQSTPYLNAFIKEVSRLYPTAPFLARTLDYEISLGDYRVPAGVPIVFSLYTTSRMEQYFEDPLAFKPERWLRESNLNTRAHAYASLPFGVGARMCIGRRMADLETSLLLASLVLKYQIHLANENDDINIKLKMILGPDKPIDLRLETRM